MAIRERSGKFQVYWTNPYSKRREAKTFKDKAEADKYNDLINFKLKHEPEFFAPEDTHESATLDEIFLGYLNEKKPSLSVLKTLKTWYKTPLLMFGRTDINVIKRPELEQIKAAQLRSVKPITAKVRMRALKTLFIWAHKRDYLAEMPKWPDPIKAAYEQFTPPTVDELKAILENATPFLTRCILLSTQLGVRVGESELLKLKWQDVQFDTLSVRVPCAKKHAGLDWRDVPISADFAEVLLKWKGDKSKDCYIASGEETQRHPSLLSAQWKSTLKKAGITRRIRPYDLRHYFATQALAGGADIGTIARLMGHANPTMVLTHYQFVLDKQKRSAIECLPKVTSYCAKV